VKKIELLHTVGEAKSFWKSTIWLIYLVDIYLKELKSGFFFFKQQTFIIVLEAREYKTRCWQIQCQVTACFLVHRWILRSFKHSTQCHSTLFLCSHVELARELFGVPFVMVFSFMRALLLWLTYSRYLLTMESAIWEMQGLVISSSYEYRVYIPRWYRPIIWLGSGCN
jgi:hypothetical protein